MKNTTLKIAAFSAALMMPAAAWAQEDEDFNPNLSLPDEEEEEGYDPNKPFNAELALEYLNNNSEGEVESEYTATLETSYHFNENFSVNGVLLGAPVRGDGAFPGDYEFLLRRAVLGGRVWRLRRRWRQVQPDFRYRL
jgi:hypothetical protein